MLFSFVRCGSRAAAQFIPNATQFVRACKRANGITPLQRKKANQLSS